MKWIVFIVDWKINVNEIDYDNLINDFVSQFLKNKIQIKIKYY